MSTTAKQHDSAGRGFRAPAGAGHAVVIGAGMAGLAVAKALTGGFERVTILDRDVVPRGVAHRKGAPQDRHLHLLLPIGADALEELFPGLRDQLMTNGATTGDTDLIRMCVNGHRLAPARTSQLGIFASRPFVEAHVRRRVHEEPAVTLRDRCRAVGLTTTPDRDRITGVEVAGSRDGAGEQLAAELVVDCSGRRSPLPDWLDGLGYRAPEVDELAVEVRYATRRYRLPAGVLDGDRHVLVGPTPHGPRGGAMTNVEDGSWIVTLFAMAGEQAPKRGDEFERFAGRLPMGDIHDAIRAGQALDEPAPYRFPANRRHRYEQLDAFPAGLLAAGDAVCTFNPIYGQGMSVAALEARHLQAQLRAGAPPAARTWFPAVASIIDAAWDLAVGSDLTVRAVEGRRDLPTRLANRYLARLHAAAAGDPTLTARFLRVAGLIDPPTRLLRPATIARVFRGTLRARRSTPHR